MKDKKSYAGIDWFRLVAAFLIAAIHISPLASQSPAADFILTRIIARTAVPFFFMTSGFFLISKYGGAGKLAAFEKKTARIYAAAVILYIPINIYNGYFTADNLLPKLIRDLVFDGTFYHLWYLPASMLGAVIARYAVKKHGFKGALVIAALLYAVGTFGNSYYELASRIPAAKGFYGLLSQVSDYTRNGIFFAPLFMVLGGLLAEREHRNAPRGLLKRDIICFAVSSALLFGEAALLRREYGAARNDSMYFFLVPCVYFLFRLLLSIEGKRRRRLRSVSLIVYIIHPMMILAVRAAARPLRLWSVLVGNGAVHYIAVSALSAALAFAAVFIWEKIRRPAKALPDGGERAWIEINTDNLKHNVKLLQGAMREGCELMAVVKANAYGHGAAEISACLERLGVRAFAVATADEGIALRKYGISGEILVLGCTSPYRAGELRRYKLIQTITDLDYARMLERQKVPVRAHIKIDTGMHRLGIDAKDVKSVKGVFSMKHIKVCGVYSHLCCSDSLREDDVLFTQKQLECFKGLLDRLRGDGFDTGKVHIQSSYGLLNYPELEFDYVRAGIALYGVLSDPGDRLKNPLELRPVLSLKSRIVLLKEVKKGESAGYNRAFTAERDSRIAILPIGYGDGIPRSLSCGAGFARIGGEAAPIAGRVCMDSLALDVTDVRDVAVGDIATLISDDAKSPVNAPRVAARSGSISNELLSRMGARLK
ncbi:MAG: serine racemase VanT catalytic subunit [Butyrivibrio sp.]|nr:serine racemase VanT catalytic subunit [Butyrivibrio sp.]